VLVGDSYDVAIIGGGIIGVSAAAFLAEAGMSVGLFEHDDVASGASGRNSGAIQHPFDPYLAELHRRTITLYRELSAGTDFELAPEPVGLLLLSADTDAVIAAAAAIVGHSPDLAPAVLDHAQLRALEPAIAPDLVACRIKTGYPVVPAAATKAFAARARRAGVTIEIGAAAEVTVAGGQAAGVKLASGRLVIADKILVAAGPWTSALIPAWSTRPPIKPLWGVVVTAALVRAPRAVLEELGIDRPGPQPEELFSLVTAGTDTSVGSTFLANQPDPQQRVAGILERAARFVPALHGALPMSVRACARPASYDGRPLIGSIPTVRGLFVCAGHGPWGISTGPASAELVVREMLGGAAAPEPISAARFAL
jgi:glycine oxidase